MTCLRLAIAGLLALTTGAAAAPVHPPEVDRAPEFRLSGDRVTLPIVMVREYPFVQARIAGVTGKLMLDTGANQALALNDHRIPLTGGQEMGRGQFGSGQTFAIRLNPTVDSVHIDRLRFPRVTQVQSQDATQLEHITPDFIGWIGYQFWKSYALKLDYRRSQATFYKGSPATYLAGEKILGVITFRLGKLPNQPLVHLRIGGIEATGAFDTGQYGALFTDEATKARLLATGTLKPGTKPDTFDLAPFEIGGRRRPGINGIEVALQPFPPATAMGVDSKTVLTIGYGFLRQFKTVWDYRQQRIYLLAR